MKGVYFGDIHSFNDLNLILAPFTPTPAEPQTNFLKVPGRDGLLDLTEANGEVKFNSREFLFTFTIAPGDDLTFDERVSKVSNALNGLQCKITLDRDPDYYWLGRCQVDKYVQNKNIGQVVVKATVNPYKLAQEENVTTFDLSSDGEWNAVLNNGRMPTIPTIECTDSCIVIFGGKTYYPSIGKNRIPEIRFVEGYNPITVSGLGTVKITWRKGEL